MLSLIFILQIHTMSAPELTEESDGAEILVSTAQNNTRPSINPALLTCHFMRSQGQHLVTSLLRTGDNVPAWAAELLDCTELILRGRYVCL